MDRMSTVRLPPAFHHVVRSLPDVAYDHQCGVLARPAMLIGGPANIPVISCVLRRGHEGRHIGAIRPRRRWFGRVSRWSYYSWGRSSAD